MCNIVTRCLYVNCNMQLFSLNFIYLVVYFNRVAYQSQAEVTQCEPLTRQLLLLYTRMPVARLTSTGHTVDRRGTGKQKMPETADKCELYCVLVSTSTAMYGPKHTSNVQAAAFGRGGGRRTLCFSNSYASYGPTIQKPSYPAPILMLSL